MIRQTQQQKLLQRLSPQQIQLMKLLQVPTASLEVRIKEEMEENPVLEFASDQIEEDNPYDDKPEQEDNFDAELELSEDVNDRVDLDDYLRHESSDNNYDYDYSNEDYYNGKEISSPAVKVESSFQDALQQQLNMYSLSERAKIIALQIIGSIDEDGYLRREINAIIDDLAFSQNLITDVHEVKQILSLIQHFEPAGIGAYTLQECLLIQAKRLVPGNKDAAIAVVILEKYFDEFSKKHFEKIQRALNINDLEFKRAMQLILRLNPKPGATYSTVSENSLYIIPDFFLYNNNGRLEVTLNSKNAPELKISEGYREILTSYDKNKKNDKQQKEAVIFIKQKLDAAKWFIDAIKQRQHTLLQTMQAIVQYQQAFFLSGDDTTMKPMILKDIAEMTGLDVSTVSRVANSKFVQTEFGTFLLKYFFSESLQTDTGEEVSTREVKRILTDVIAEENKRKPLSDEALMKILENKGYVIARRTIAKYREQLNIPVARLRREV